MIVRLINVQGWIGLAGGTILAALLLVQKVETRHWKKQSGQYEQLYRAEQSALAGTIANYRAATDAARAADRVNAERVAAEQRAINERSQDALEKRLADARSVAERLRRESGAAAADPGGRRAAPVPGLPAPPGQPPQAAGKDRLPVDDALTATEQAIQLDELIKWVRRQQSIDPNKAAGAQAK